MSKVSVLIATINDKHLSRTVENLQENADNELEFIIINDGGSEFTGVPVDTNSVIITHNKVLGRRVSFNQAAKLATGEYLFIIDAHCSMSKHWDSLMIESCVGNNLVHCIIRDMWPDSWEYRPGDYSFVYLNPEYTEKWWNRKPLNKCNKAEENMCITGCAFMLRKEAYFDMGGYDESLGAYGWDGPEWTCKVWMDYGGKVILRTDVICGHIFGTNSGNVLYPLNIISKQAYIEYMSKRYSNKVQDLIKRFSPVPGWESKEPKMIPRKGTGREIKFERKRETIKKNNDTGVVVSKIIQYLEFVFNDDGSGGTEEEILAKTPDSAFKVVRTETWEVKDGKLCQVS